MYTIFPPPPKPPKKNYIKENIKQLQTLQLQNKQDVGKTNLFKHNNKTTNAPIRTIPRAKTEPQLTCKIKETNEQHAIKQKNSDPIKSTSKTNLNYKNKINVKQSISSHSLMFNHRQNTPQPRTPKLRDASCQYLESDSRYYFADGSTVHFIYPSERKSIFARHNSTMRSTGRNTSVYHRTTESYRRKHLDKILSKKQSALDVNKTEKDCKDADSQYNELDLIEHIPELPEDGLNTPIELKNIPSQTDVEIPKLNLKESMVDLVDGIESMASIIEAKRCNKPQESLRSGSESSISLHLDDKQIQNTVEASVVPMVDVQAESENIKDSDKSVTHDEMVKKLKSQFSRRVSELNHMPMRSDTLRARTRKIQLERELKELENSIRMLAFPRSRALHVRATS